MPQTQQRDIPNAQGPKWHWRSGSWWVNAIGIALVLLPVHPLNLFEARFGLWLRIAIAVAIIFAVPVIFKFLYYLYSWSRVVIIRAKHYTFLFELYERGNDELLQTKGLVQELGVRAPETQTCRIYRVQLYNDTLYLVINKNQSPSMQEGTQLVVLDAGDGSLMGYFEITEVRSDEYLAVNVGYVSPIWLGYAHTISALESLPPPNTLVLIGDVKDEQ